MLYALTMHAAPHYLIVVRSGATELFEWLTGEVAREPYPSTLLWDRRRGDRRVASRPFGVERRRGERRASPDAIWRTHGFLVAATVGAPARISEAYRNPAALAELSMSLSSVGRPEAGWPRKGVLAAAMFTLRLRAKLEDGHQSARTLHPG